MDQQIQQSIYEAIDVVVNKKNSQLQFDRTIDCVIEEVKNLTTGEYKVRYLDEAFSALDYQTRIMVTKDIYRILKNEFVSFAYNGNMFMPKHICEKISLTDGKQVRVYDEDGTFIAIYAFCKEKWMFQIVKMFLDKNN